MPFKKPLFGKTGQREQLDSSASVTPKSIGNVPRPRMSTPKYDRTALNRATTAINVALKNLGHRFSDFVTNHRGGIRDPNRRKAKSANKNGLRDPQPREEKNSPA